MNGHDDMPARPGDIHLLIHALVDGELDAATAIEVERRIVGDPALAAEHARIAALSAAIRRLPGAEVSDALHARIAGFGASDADTTGFAAGRRAARGFSSFDWRAMAASIVVSAVLASSGTYWATRSPPMSFADAVADAHRRGLLASTPVDVASSDRHTVKPWLDGRIGLSPPAVDLAGQGFKLIGGRVEVVGDAPVPALIYQSGEHLITLIAAPRNVGGRPAKAEDLSAGGFALVHWSDAAFSYWAISDMERAKLNTFVSRFQAAVALE